MLGISKANIRKLVGSDVRTVVAEAQYLLWVHIDEQGKYVVKYEKNPDGKLSIMAVVGEGVLEGVTYPLALLCEIGLRRGKPYQRSRTQTKRRPWFSMTKEQYQAAGFYIFWLLQKIADERICAWLFGNRKSPRNVSISLQRWSRRKGCMEIKKKQLSYLNGIRFSVLLKEDFIIKDLYWAEAYHNSDIQRITGGLVYFIKQVLAPYKNRRPNRKDFFSLKKTALMRDKLLSSSLPAHLKYRLLWDYFQNSPYWHELCSILDWDGESFPPEYELPSTVRPDCFMRGIKVRILPRPGSKYFLFEMYEHE